MTLMADDINMRIFASLSAEQQAELLAALGANGTIPDDRHPRAAVTGCGLDDTGNAERFVALFGDGVRYDHTSGRWLIATATHWRIDDDGAIHRMAKAAVRSIYDEARLAPSSDHAKRLARWAAISASDARRGAMLNIAKSELPVSVTRNRLNVGDNLVNCLNGTLNLDTGQLHPHRPERLLTYVIPAEYNPDAECPTWMNFLQRVMNGNSDMVNFLQRAVGYTLHGDNREQCLFFLYGTGANGKSTFIETVASMLGELATKARANVFMHSERETIPNEVAALAGRRLVVASELASHHRLNESLVKDMTGNDMLSARFLYKEFFTFRPTHTLWLYGNTKPAIYGTDDGIWRRVMLVPFTVQIPPAERNGGLQQLLRAEYNGILAWAVRGWQQVQTGGLRPPDEVTQATNIYRRESDELASFFDERCELVDDATVAAGELYGAYTNWRDENGMKRISNRVLSKQMSERGFSSSQDATTRRKLWQGIRVA